MTTTSYPLICGVCGGEASNHPILHDADGKPFVTCPRTAASLYAEECARLARDVHELAAVITNTVGVSAETIAELDALRVENAKLQALLVEAIGTHGDSCDQGCDFVERARAALTTPEAR